MQSAYHIIYEEFHRSRLKKLNKLEEPLLPQGGQCGQPVSAGCSFQAEDNIMEEIKMEDWIINEKVRLVRGPALEARIIVDGGKSDLTPSEVGKLIAILVKTLTYTE